MNVIPATQEAEAGELLEPGRRKVSQDCTTNSSLGNKSKTQSQKKSTQDLSALFLTIAYESKTILK